MMQNNKIWNICANTKSPGLKFCRVDVYQELHMNDSGYDVPIATYLLPDLYLLKRKNALFVFPESNALSCVRAV